LASIIDILRFLLTIILYIEQSNFSRTLTELGDGSEISASLTRIIVKDQGKDEEKVFTGGK